MKKKILDIFIWLIGLIILITIILIAIKYGGNMVNEQEMSSIVEQIKTIDLEKEKQEDQSLPNEGSNIETENIKENVTEIEIDGYKVLGIIRIPKIGLEYPILSETTNKSMKKSITKFWGPELNQIGNLTLAGHNNHDGTMFGKVKKLEIGDIIEIEDLYKNVVKYKIFDMYVTDPNDVSCVVSVDPDSREVTLITCTNGNKNRLITKAREII